AAGANDYLAKPYAPEELRARAQALVRSAGFYKRALAAEQVVRELLANSPDAFLAIDSRGKITYANKEAGLVFGVAADSLNGREVKTLLPTLSLGSMMHEPGRSHPPLPD